MQVAPPQTMSIIPSLGAMLGSIQSAQMLDHINSMMGGTASVSFGQLSNPMNDGYRNFMNLVQGQLSRTDRIIQQVTQSIEYPEHWRVIDNDDALYAPPPSMQPALLMTPGVFELFKEGKLSGWNWDPSTFPEEDVYGIQLNSGHMVVDPRDRSTIPEYIETEWHSEYTDFEMTPEQIDILEKSREYLTARLNEELGDNGKRRDITDLGNTMPI